MTTVELNDGRKMPIIGLGTWQSPKDTVYEAVKEAIKVGYRHFDCALVYENEAEVGKAVREAMDEGLIKREDIWVTSKLWNAFHSKKNAPKSLAMSLERLGLDYVDLYLIHWPVGFKENEDDDEPIVMFPRDEAGKLLFSDVDYIETYKAMEDLQKTGKVKSIGVSNFNIEQMGRVINECTVVPAVNQVECHPYLNQSELIAFCDKHNIKVTAYSPLGSPGSPFNPECGPVVLKEPGLVKLAQKYHKTPAQVALRYNIQRGVIVVPKTVTKTRIRENFEVFDFHLTDMDLKVIDAFHRDLRYIIPRDMIPNKNFPFKDLPAHVSVPRKE